MGGKKKLTLKKMARIQKREQSKEGGSGASVTKKAVAGIFPPDPGKKGVVDKLRKMKVLTPYTVASSLDLRLSAAKHFLRDLERQGTVECVSRGKNLKIYKMAD